MGKAERVGGKVQKAPSALERAGIARRIRFHDLRGTTATHLALGSWGRPWTLNEVQQFLSHSDQRVTERYVRRAQDALAQAAKATLGGPAAQPSGDRAEGRVGVQQVAMVHREEDEGSGRASVGAPEEVISASEPPPILPPAIDENPTGPARFERATLGSRDCRRCQSATG